MVSAFVKSLLLPGMLHNKLQPEKIPLRFKMYFIVKSTYKDTPFPDFSIWNIPLETKTRNPTYISKKLYIFCVLWNWYTRDLFEIVNIDCCKYRYYLHKQLFFGK